LSTPDADGLTDDRFVSRNSRPYVRYVAKRLEINDS